MQLNEKKKKTKILRCVLNFLFAFIEVIFAPVMEGTNAKITKTTKVKLNKKRIDLKTQ